MRASLANAEIGLEALRTTTDENEARGRDTAAQIASAMLSTSVPVNALGTTTVTHPVNAAGTTTTSIDSHSGSCTISTPMVPCPATT